MGAAGEAVLGRSGAGEAVASLDEVLVVDGGVLVDGADVLDGEEVLDGDDVLVGLGEEGESIPAPLACSCSLREVTVTSEHRAARRSRKTQDASSSSTQHSRSYFQFPPFPYLPPLLLPPIF